MHEVHECIHNQANQCLGPGIQTSCVQMSPDKVGSQVHVVVKPQRPSFCLFCEHLHLQSTCPFF